MASNKGMTNEPEMFETKRDDSYSTESTEKMAKKIKINNIYKCCGAEIDRRILLVILQIVVVLTTLIFSMFMISKTEGGESTVWISIISALVGNHMPSYINREHQDK